MHLNKELELIKDNLKQNLQRLINREPLEYFKFREFLEAVLIRSGRKIIAHDFKMVNDSALELEKEYARLINILDGEVVNGELIGIHKHINKSVNGKFDKIIRDFIFKYDKKILQENKYR